MAAVETVRTEYDILIKVNNLLAAEHLRISSKYDPAIRANANRHPEATPEQIAASLISVRGIAIPSILEQI